MKSLVKAALVAVALEIAGGPAQSQSLQITGTAGYLSEWELSGVLTESASSGGVEYFGPLIWKHVGLCSVNGPQEKYGEIRLRMYRSEKASRINAAISLEGVQCAYSGDFSGRSSGDMDCSDAKGVPLSFLIN
jgi:hypothetical protein